MLPTEITENTGLPHYVRFRDLVKAGLITNWPTLLRSDGSEGPTLELRPLFEQFQMALFEHIHMEAR